jgi:hypothetical protein
MSLGAPILALDCNELTGITLGGVATLLPNNGSAWTGGTLGAAAQAAKFGTAATFNGTSGVASLGDVIDIAPSSPITLCCWYKTSSTAGQSLVRRSLSATQNQYALYRNAGGFVACSFGGSGAAINIADTVNTADGNWHHAAAVNTGTLFSLYVDGVLIGSRAPGATSYAAHLLVGARNNGTTGSYATYCVGAMDEIRIYNTAATAGEIAGIMNGDYLANGLLARRRRMMQCA